MFEKTQTAPALRPPSKEAILKQADGLRELARRARRLMETMSDEGIVRKNKGHGWTFLPAINNETSLRNSYDFRRMLEPNQQQQQQQQAQGN